MNFPFLIPFVMVSIVVIVMWTYYIVRRIQFGRAISFAFSNPAYCQQHACHGEFSFDRKVLAKTKNFHIYSPLVAYYCLFLIRQVYDATTDSQLQVPDGFELLASFQNGRDNNKNIGYLLWESDPRILWIVFRGTVDYQDIKKDVNMRQEGFIQPGILVHKGFLTIYQTFRASLVTSVLRYRHEKRPSSIIITGHSLGGGLSLLSLADIVTLKNDPSITSPSPNVMVYTYGCPRVGNQSFVRYLEYRHASDACFRIANSEDIFTHVPLPITLHVIHPVDPFYYEHYGRSLIFSDNRSNYIYNHSIDTYIDNITRIVNVWTDTNTIPSSLTALGLW